MPTWSTYLRIFIFTALLSILLLYLFILLVDPYDNVPFSLPLEREPISTNQRFAYPSLARKPGFDSAVIGTSTARLLKPERLNELTGNNWVNLAMNSATAYEQIEMLNLFLRHHPGAKHIVIGIDDAWCRPGKEIQKFTFRPFPPWMYDENRWNDLLYLFNDKALENAVRLVEYWAGKREAKYDGTGYRDFTEDFGEYDITVIKEKLSLGLYKQNELAPNKLILQNEDIDDRFLYGAHSLLASRLSSFSNVELTVLFMPLHANYLHRSAANYKNCKARILRIGGNHQNVKFIDRMQIDEMTTDDQNYWDPLHFTSETAVILERIIHRNSASRR